jgi:general transcription factor IIIA
MPPQSIFFSLQLEKNFFVNYGYGYTYDRQIAFNMSTLPEDPDNFVHLSLSGSDSESDSEMEPVSTPPTPRTPRPSEIKTIPCPYEGCQKSFNRQARLTEHLRSHTNTRPFKCPHKGCSKDFLRDSHLKHHVKSAHTDVRDYVCSWDGCCKSFATGTRLRRHEAAHQQKEKWRCRGYKGCNETFRKHDTLKRHIMIVHEDKRPFPCPDVDMKTGEPCKSAFETTEKLRAHQRAKHDQTRFACTECLEQTLHTHSGDEVVDASKKTQVEVYFASYADLQLHITAVHPPTCPHCPTALSTPRELKRHLELVHNIPDPVSQQSNAAFPCTYTNCNRSFSKKGNLNVHIKTVHLKRRDFVCGETNLNLSDLAKSQPLAEDVVEIEGCGRDFTSKSSLEEHVRTAHLGLGSKRVERNKKRKATAMKLSGEQPQQKKRKSRKSQGKKTAALSTLTGVPYDAEGSSEDGDDEMGELTGFETIVDGQIYGQDLGFTEHVAYGQRTYDPQGYYPATSENMFNATELFDDAEFIPHPQLDPLLLLSS